MKNGTVTPGGDRLERSTATDCNEIHPTQDNRQDDSHQFLQCEHIGEELEVEAGADMSRDKTGGDIFDQHTC